MENKPFIVIPTEKRIDSRCGYRCNERTLHRVMVYDFEGKKNLALECVRCGVITITFIPFPEDIHGFTT